MHLHSTGMGMKANWGMFQQERDSEHGVTLLLLVLGALIIAEAELALRQQQDELAWEDSGLQITQDTDRDTVSSLGLLLDANFCLHQT